VGVVVAVRESGNGARRCSWDALRHQEREVCTSLPVQDSSITNVP
jgi:hypothetical protein